MLVRLVDLHAQYESIKPEVDDAISRVLGHTGFIMGKEVSDFEHAFAAFVGVPECVGVASGTAALLLALQACGIGGGDEVITTAHTFIATSEAISHLGARPVFVDIDPATYNIDPQRVEAAITARTRAILPVHLYGQPAAMDELSAIAQRRGLFLIEDAAQAHGAVYHGRNCGSLGHLACFSFYPGKNLGAFGDAGAVTGKDPTLIERVRKLRDHGRLSKYEHEEIGLGERLDALQAAILGAKLPYLRSWIDARRRHAASYNELLEDFPLRLPFEARNVAHAYHLYVIRTPQREALLSHLVEQGIGAGVHYPTPLHRQPAYLKQGYGDISLPKTEEAASEVLSLPLYPEMTVEQIQYVAEAVGKFPGWAQ